MKAFISYEAGWYVDKIVLPLESADKIPKGTVNIKFESVIKKMKATMPLRVAIFLD